MRGLLVLFLLVQCIYYTNAQVSVVLGGGAPGSFADVPCTSSTTQSISIPTSTTTTSTDATITFTVDGDLDYSLLEYLPITCEGFSFGIMCNGITGDDIFGGLTPGDICNQCNPSGPASATIPQASWSSIIADGSIDCSYDVTTENTCSLCGTATGMQFAMEFTWTAGAGSGGDPHIMGFNNEFYELEVPVGSVVNFFSSPLMQLNGMVQSPALRPNVMYIEEIGVALHNNTWQIFVDVDASEIGVDSAVVMELRNQEQQSRFTLEELREMSVASGFVGIDLSQEEEEEEQLEECRVLVVTEEDNKELFDSMHSWVTSWTQSPIIRSRLRCEGQETLIEVHEMRYEIEPSDTEGIGWVSIGKTLFPVSTVGLEEMIYIERRIDVFFSRVTPELRPEGVVGRTHKTTIDYKRSMMQQQQQEEDRNDGGSIRKTKRTVESGEEIEVSDALVDTLSSDSEYILESGDLYGGDFSWNRFVN